MARRSPPGQTQTSCARKTRNLGGKAKSSQRNYVSAVKISGAQKQLIIPKIAGSMITKVNFLNTMVSQYQTEAIAITKSLAGYLTCACKDFSPYQKASKSIADTMVKVSQYLTIHPRFEVMGQVAVL